MPRSNSLLRSLVELAGSIRLGVVLLVALAASSVLGTVILQSTLPGGDALSLTDRYGETTCRLFEALHLTDVFHAWWYVALMGLVALNVLCATIARFSVRLEKLGFLAAHLGVLLVLVAGAIYVRFGDKGLIVLREGETADKYFSRRDRFYHDLGFSVTLKRFRIAHYPGQMVFVGPQEGTVSVRPRAGREVSLPWADARVRFERVVEDARYLVEVLPGRPGEDAGAAHMKIETADGTAEVWRFAGEDGPAESLVTSDGRLAVLFDDERTRGGTDRVPAEPRLYLINRSTREAASVPARVDETFKLPGVDPPASGRIVAILDDADNTTLGPGLRLEIRSEGSTGLRHVFAKHPGFNPERFTALPVRSPQVRFVYYRPRVVLHLVRTPDAACVLRSHVDGAWETQTLSPNTPVEAGPVKVTLLEVLDAARVEERYEPAAEPTGLDAALLSVSADGERYDFWMATAGDGKAVKVSERLTIGYVASMHVRDYQSEVTLTDVDGASLERSVHVNRPAWHRGWQIFQEGYFPAAAGSGSQLAVSRDPGLLAAYVGLVMIAAGVFYACFIKPVIVKRKQRP